MPGWQHAEAGMLKDITLGQYFPGTSVLHRMNPTVKIIGTVMFLVAVFLCRSLLSFVFILSATAAFIAISRVPFRVILKSLKPLLFILIFTTLYSVFFVKGENLLFEWKIIHIYREGVVNALLTDVRIICLLAGSSVILTYTTSPIMLTDGLEELMKPLKLFRVDVHVFSMMMSIALRFIPTLIEETDRIISAQKSRGADFESGNLLRRAKALIPVIIPLFSSSIRHAIDLSTAMECRCYHGSKGRTRMKDISPKITDWLSLLIFAAIIAAVVLLNVYVPPVLAGIGMMGY